MSSTRRTQTSLASFFKSPPARHGAGSHGTPAPAADNSARRGTARTQESPPAQQRAAKKARHRRRAIDEDGSDSESEDCGGTSLHSGAGGQAQSAGRTLVRSVSDTASLMERLRMRAKEADPAASPAPPAALVAPDALESTAIQLVERRPGVKYTPLEAQVLDEKARHPDMLLAVEVGYKFRFFGEDARIASQVLGIMCTTANNFYNASIPTPRLMVHARRLVLAGYKVGIMRQRETAALKAVSDNRNAPFTRQLCEVYTAGTLIEEVSDGPAPGASGERYLLCPVERLVDGKDKRVCFGLLAVQITTGDVVYDQFDDGYLRSALETRLMHLQPGEILVPPGLSAETLRTLSAYVGYRIDYCERREPLLEHANRTGVRVAFGAAELLDCAAARSLVADFYTDGGAAALLVPILELPDSVVTALALLIAYLKTFQLDRALLAGKTASAGGPFAPFHTRLHMLLSATALQTLSVFTAGSAGGAASDEPAVALKELLKPGGRSAGAHSAHVPGGDGSLFGVMDRTRSQFGRRMLRRWVAHPLVSHDRLTDRLESVEFLKRVLEDADAGALDGPENSSRQALAGIHSKIGQLVDLERGLCRIHYGQASPQELLRILRSLGTATSLVPPGFEIAEPRLLAEVLGCDTWSAELRESVAHWRSQVDYGSARSGRKETLFVTGPLHDHVQGHHDRLAGIEADLQAHVATVREQLGDDRFEFKSVSGTDYLIDVTNGRAKSVPADWVKISGTKTHSRFHTPFIVGQLAERERSREALQQAARDAYGRFLAGIAEQYAPLRRMITALATVDALFSLAVLARTDGYCRPELVGGDHGEAAVELVDAVNPVLAARTTAYVPNTVRLGHDAGAARAMILTGPNAGGKSSLIRTVALISVMAQCGSYVPAASARLSIIDAIVTRMGASDNLMAGESTFMVEMRETAELIRQVTPRSLAILDELGRGTSTHDGAAIAFAVLSHLVERRPLTFFVTHYAHLVGAFAGNAMVQPCHMSFLERKPPAQDQSGDGIAEVTFLYKLVDGASTDSFGLNVARIAGLPESLLRCARERAARMRTDLDSRWAAHCAGRLRLAVAQARRAHPE
ncbi:Mismatch repair protein msh3 [Coemansia spiralis]|nr:Mismatch repair protein msh3 [Coemansia spiralis]